jgi:hypothetical protein
MLYLVNVELTYASTEVVWADTAGRAEDLAISIAEEDSYPSTWVDSTPIENVADLPKEWWDECPAGDDDRTCLELLKLNLTQQVTEIDTRQLWLGEKPTRRSADQVDRVCSEYARLLTRLQGDDYTAEELDRCYELAHDPRVQQRLEAARQRDIEIAKK